jgi:tRNA nucleotidyltransferase/poly(A) polymerase
MDISNTETNSHNKTDANNSEILITSSFPLTDLENKVFTFLLDVVHYYNLKTTLRVAGGWVRDKLLGTSSGDIDIALDNMTGKEFAEYVNKYLELRGEKTHTIGVIQTNPDQSKHLETATMRVFDIWLDFVNLRAEEYTETSRIPSRMRIGTPEEDAKRRDLTINSLFYNINKGVVEDWTRKGIEDLREGVIRTPLAPLETFLDDPLRVLRAIRFAARLQFTCHSELQLAAKSLAVKDALRNKVSRERIGKEFEGMVKSLRPDLAFKLILDFELWDIVFALPENKTWEHSATVAVNYSRQVCRLLRSLPSSISISESSRRLIIISSLFIPLAERTYINAKKKKEPLAQYVTAESLKLPKKDTEHTLVVLHTFKNWQRILQLLQNDCNFEINRKEVGLLMRETKELWLESLLLGALDLLPPFSDEIRFHSPDSPCNFVFIRFLLMINFEIYSSEYFRLNLLNQYPVAQKR